MSLLGVLVSALFENFGFGFDLIEDFFEGFGLTCAVENRRLLAIVYG